MENKMLIKEIKKIYKDSRQTYGSPRITAELRSKNILVSRPRVARLMKQEKIRSKTKKKYVITTDSKHSFSIAPNLVDRNFTVQTPGKVWVSDITYIKTT
jgi:transposase InsO family protein